MQPIVTSVAAPPIAEITQDEAKGISSAFIKAYYQGLYAERCKFFGENARYVQHNGQVFSGLKDVETAFVSVGDIDKIVIKSDNRIVTTANEILLQCGGVYCMDNNEYPFTESFVLSNVGENRYAITTAVFKWNGECPAGFQFKNEVALPAKVANETAKQNGKKIEAVKTKQSQASAVVKTNEHQSGGSNSVVKTNERQSGGSNSVVKTNERQSGGSNSVVKTNERQSGGSNSVVKTNERQSQGPVAGIKTNERQSQGSIAVVKTNERQSQGSPAAVKTNERQSQGSTAVVKTKERQSERSPEVVKTKERQPDGTPAVMKTGEESLGVSARVAPPARFERSNGVTGDHKKPKKDVKKRVDKDVVLNSVETKPVEPTPPVPVKNPLVLHVSGLRFTRKPNYSALVYDLNKHFNQFGPVSQVNLPRRAFNSDGPIYAFIEYEDNDIADKIFGHDYDTRMGQKRAYHNVDLRNCCYKGSISVSEARGRGNIGNRHQGDEDIDNCENNWAGTENGKPFENKKHDNVHDAGFKNPNDLGNHKPPVMKSY